MNKTRFKLNSVIFDMDGVITHTMPYHYKAWVKVFSERGVRLSKQDVYMREGQRGLKALKEIFNKYGLLYSTKDALNLLADKEKYFKKIVKTRYIPGSRSFLNGLKRKGFLLGLVTGTSRHELKKILPKDKLELFSVVVSGSDVKNGKPHPQPYFKALKALKISCRDAIVIENAPLGIISAKAAGIKCIALETSLKKEFLDGADLVFSSFKELNENVLLEHKK